MSWVNRSIESCLSLVKKRGTAEPSPVPRPDEIVQGLYRGMLGREASREEVAAWVADMRGGRRLSDIVEEFVFSPESLQRLEQRAHALPPAIPNGAALTILDIGAQRVEGEVDPFRPLLDGGNCRVIGIEPLEATHQDRLNEDPDWTLLPYFAGDGSTRTFYETEWGPTSSLYAPNLTGISDFTGLAEISTVAKTTEVQTRRLDDVFDEDVHFLKLDVQGGELDVLKGAVGLLTKVLVIHTEVEFYPMYQDQPLFDDVSRFLLEHGFELFDLPRLIKYSYQPAAEPLERLLWGEAVFIPTRDRIDQLDRQGTRRLARIMHDAYGAMGFSRWLLERFESRV